MLQIFNKVNEALGKLSFKKKVFFTYFAVFCLFLLLLYPFAESSVQDIVKQTMLRRAEEVVVRLKTATTNEALVRRLKELRSNLFFRISVITNDGRVLYDSHAQRLLGPRFSLEYVVDHPEVTEAFQRGVGYAEGFSELFQAKFAYLAKSFDFHGNTYVIRVAFPYDYITQLRQDFVNGFLFFGTAALMLFAVMTWLVINRLTSPIQEIIHAVKEYQEGIDTHFPEIHLQSKGDDFERLADTFNSLSRKVRSQIDALTGERNEKEAVLESLVEGVVAVDASLTVTYANKLFLNFLGLSQEELIGKNFSTAGKPKWSHLLIESRQQQEVKSDMDQIHANGKFLQLDLAAAPIKAMQGSVLVLQDKTAHYKMLRMQKDFVANASHELRTPITIIRGFAETLHDNPQMKQETMLMATSKIVRNCERMSHLIKDLLLLSDIEHLQESQLEKTDFYSLLHSCKTMLLDAHPQVVVQEEYEEGLAPIKVDKNLLELALMNLLENGVKYSRDTPTISLSLRKSKDKYLISIADKGMGIPKEDLEHIFDRFYTVDKAHSRKMGGAGLGLSLVKTIVDKHYGKIFVESELGQGTVFTIALPIDL